MVVSALFLWMIRQYLGAIFWAVILAGIFYPVQARFETLTKGKISISALLTLLTLFVAVFIPLYFLGNAVVQQSIGLYQQVTTNQNVLQDSFEVVNGIIPLDEWMMTLGMDADDLRAKITESAQSISGYIFSGAAKFGQNTLQFVAQFVIMFYVLFFFLKDGPRLLEKLMHLIPLGDRKEKRLYRKFMSVSRATIKGTLIIGAVQGVLGGILFWSVGISAPVLWGALMAVLSIIPAVGSFLIWGPVGLFLLFTGNLVQGVIVLIVGSFVISLVDNVLRPPLVGKDTEMHEALILLSTLGGLSVFGISGFVIGPILAAFFVVMWEMFEEEYHKDLVKKG